MQTCFPEQLLGSFVACQWQCMPVQTAWVISISGSENKVKPPQLRLRGQVVQTTIAHPESHPELSKTRFKNTAVDHDLLNEISETSFWNRDANLLSDTWIYLYSISIKIVSIRALHLQERSFCPLKPLIRRIYIAKIATFWSYHLHLREKSRSFSFTKLRDFVCW